MAKDFILSVEQIAFNRERLLAKHSLHPDLVLTILDSHEAMRREMHETGWMLRPCAEELGRESVEVIERAREIAEEEVCRLCALTKPVTSDSSVPSV